MCIQRVIPDGWTLLMSRCKLSITDGRNRLKVDIVEVVECLHWWLGGGIVRDILQSITMEELMDGSNNA